MLIRTAAPADDEAIAEVLALAFGGPDEALLVELIRNSDRYVPDMSIVADDGEEVVGHVLFSYVTIVGAEDLEVLSLAPLAVHPAHQGRRIGSRLVEEGLARAEEREEPLVVVEGIPTYYPRFGFERASLHGIGKPAPQVPDEAFMVKRLTAYRSGYRGRLVYPPAFHEANAIGG